jgi:signal transduction histidine kinase
MTAPPGHAASVHRALTTAGLFFAGITPVIQLAAFHSGAQPAPVWTAFAVHGLVWLGAVGRRLPAATVLASWSLIAVTIAAQLMAAGAAEPVAARNIALTIAATAALLLPLRQALATSAVASLATGATLLACAEDPTLSLCSIALQTPVYCVSVAAALGLAFRELRRVAAQADDQARAQLEADRTTHGKQLALEAARRRARTLHDTVVNTLGTIATGRIVSADALVARRCAEDAHMVDVLRRSASPHRPSVDDVFAHAAAVGVDLRAGEDLPGLERRLDTEQPWRRREVIAILRETVTNIAKHAQVRQAHLTYDAEASSVTISDDGVGMFDSEALAKSLADRSRDARADVQIRSEPGVGTFVRLEIPPLDAPATGIFETASTRMATAISVVMLIEFAVIAALITTFHGDWSASAVLPPLLLWSTAGAVLALLLTHAGRERTLPTWVVFAAYLGLFGMVAIYQFADASGSVCGLKPALAWGGDVLATVGAILILIDGRARVVGPAVGLPAIAVLIMLAGTGSDCVGSTLGLFVTDLLIIGAFYILRHQTLRMSTMAAGHHRDQMSRREELERLAAENALHDDGLTATLEFSRDILQAVAEHPRRAGDPDTRAAAALEEKYLRALIGLTADIATSAIMQQFVEVIDSARTAGVGISVHAAPRVLDDDRTPIVVSTIRHVIENCDAGDEVTIGAFGPEPSPSLMVVAPPHVVTEFARGTTGTTSMQPVQVAVTAELGLIEIRWFDGAHSSS